METTPANLSKNNSNKKFPHLSWFPVALWMIIIFWFSAQPAIDSGNMSGTISQFILNVSEQLSLNFITNVRLETINFLVRKLAHFSEYLFLGILVSNALYTSKIRGKHAILIAFLICCSYAISDELHQLFVPGRSNQIRDVLIDSAGSLFGIFFFIKIIDHMRKTH